MSSFGSHRRQNIGVFSNRVNTIAIFYYLFAPKINSYYPQLTATYKTIPRSFIKLDPYAYMFKKKT